MANWKTPSDLKYSKSDEWYRLDGDVVTMGISDYAQDQLSDIVYVELPEVGTKVSAGDSIGVVESVKAASDIYTAIGGEIIEVNSSLEDTPEKINSEPFEGGWFAKIKISDTKVLESLLDSAAYAEHCAKRDH